MTGLKKVINDSSKSNGEKLVHLSLEINKTKTWIRMTESFKRRNDLKKYLKKLEKDFRTLNG